MAISYKICEFNFNNKNGKAQKFMKIIPPDKIDEYHTADRICDANSVTQSDVAAVLEAWFMRMKNEFVFGNSIDLGDIGSMKLIGEMEFDDGGKPVNGSERVKKIEFIPFGRTRRFLDTLQFKNCGETDAIVNDRETRIENAMAHIAESGFITSMKYRTLNNCSKTTAINDLNYMREQKMITRSCEGGGWRYGY